MYSSAQSRSTNDFIYNVLELFYNIKKISINITLVIYNYNIHISRMQWDLKMFLLKKSKDELWKLM